MRRVLEIDVVNPPTSPNTEMSLPPTPGDPFKQGTTPDNANDPCKSQPNSTANPLPTHEGAPSTPGNPFKGGSPMEARPPVQQQEVQLYEGDLLELEAEGQDTEFPDVTPPLTERESNLKKELEALQEKAKKQREKTKRLKAKNKKLKEQVAAKNEVATSDSKIPCI